MPITRHHATARSAPRRRALARPRNNAAVVAVAVAAAAAAIMIVLTPEAGLPHVSPCHSSVAFPVLALADVVPTGSAAECVFAANDGRAECAPVLYTVGAPRTVFRRAAVGDAQEQASGRLVRSVSAVIAPGAADEGGPFAALSVGPLMQDPDDASSAVWDVADLDVDEAVAGSMAADARIGEGWLYYAVPSARQVRRTSLYGLALGVADRAAPGAQDSATGLSELVVSLATHPDDVADGGLEAPKHVAYDPVLGIGYVSGTGGNGLAYFGIAQPSGGGDPSPYWDWALPDAAEGSWGGLAVCALPFDHDSGFSHGVFATHAAAGVIYQIVMHTTVDAASGRLLRQGNSDMYSFVALPAPADATLQFDAGRGMLFVALDPYYELLEVADDRAVYACQMVDHGQPTLDLTTECVVLSALSAEFATFPDAVTGIAGGRDLVHVLPGQGAMVLYTSALRFFEAEQYCIDTFGGHLASVATREQMVALSDAIIAQNGGNSNIMPWIGLNDIAVEDTWQWTDGSPDAEYFGWANNQPDNNFGSEHCVHLWHYRNGAFEWNDSECGWQRPSVCELPEASAAVLYGIRGVEGGLDATPHVELSANPVTGDALQAEWSPTTSGGVGAGELPSGTIGTGADFGGYGNGMNPLMDVNDDGIGDMVVGLAGDHDGAGSAVVLMLDPSVGGQWVKGASKIDYDNAAFAAAGGAIGEASSFGSSVTGLRDWDGDGYPEVAIGAVGHSSPGCEAHGAVHLVMLGSNAAVRATRRYTNSESGVGAGTLDCGTQLGMGIGAVDLGAAGYFPVQAIVAGGRGDGDGGAKFGSVWVIVVDPTTYDAESVTRVSQGAGYSGGGLLFVSPTVDQQFGAAITADIGDINLDGVNDMAVSAPNDGQACPTCGAVYVLLLDDTARNGVVKERVKLSGAPTGNGNHQVSGGAGLSFTAGDTWGVGLSAAPDLNGDGVPELLVCGGKAGGTSHGRVDLVFLQRDGTPVSGAALVLFQSTPAGHPTLSVAVAGSVALCPGCAGLPTVLPGTSASAASLPPVAIADALHGGGGAVFVGSLRAEASTVPALYAADADTEIVTGASASGSRGAALFASQALGTSVAMVARVCAGGCGAGCSGPFPDQCFLGLCSAGYRRLAFWDPRTGALAADAACCPSPTEVELASGVAQYYARTDAPGPDDPVWDCGRCFQGCAVAPEALGYNCTGPGHDQCAVGCRDGYFDALGDDGDTTTSACTQCSSPGAGCAEDSYAIPGSCTGYDDAACGPCHGNCSACSGPAADQCTSCAAGHTAVGPGGALGEVQCGPCIGVDACEAGTEYLVPSCSDASDNACGACAAACSADPVFGGCTGPSNGHCVQCAIGYWATLGACVPWTDCVDAGHYEVAAPTSTTDRVCAPVTQCEAGVQWMQAPATATTDAVCAAVTACRNGTHYTAVAATATSDAVCAGVSSCGPGKWAASPATATSDAVCADLSVCDPLAATDASFERLAPTNTSDRVCAALRVCDADEYESAAPTATSDRVCAPVTPCPSRAYELLAPSATNDRHCLPCDEACASCAGASSADCAVVDTEAGAVADCAAGWTDPTRAHQCRACATNCTRGAFAAAACNATHDLSCAACHTTCGVGGCDGPTAADCVDCGPGHFLARVDGASSGGGDVGGGGSGDGGGGGGGEDATFACSPCSKCEDTYLVSACAGTADAVCGACNDACGLGATCSGPDASQCGATAACAAGHFISDADVASGAVTCTPCSECAPGFTESGGCDGRIDTICENLFLIVTASGGADGAGVASGSASGDVSLSLSPSRDPCADINVSLPFAPGDDERVLLSCASTDAAVAWPNPEFVSFASGAAASWASHRSVRVCTSRDGVNDDGPYRQATITCDVCAHVLGQAPSLASATTCAQVREATASQAQTSSGATRTADARSSVYAGQDSGIPPLVIHVFSRQAVWPFLKDVLVHWHEDEAPASSVVRPPPNSATPAVFSLSLSGQVQLTLVGDTSRRLVSGPHFVPGVTVTIGGVQATDVVISEDGTRLDCVSPSYSELCGGSGDAGGDGDCGYHTLVVSNPAVTASAVAARPAAFTPAMVGSLGAEVSCPPDCAGGSVGKGAFYTAACAGDSDFTQGPQCATMAAAATCAFGAGDACEACPAPMAVCPGGSRVWPQPGYWVVSERSIESLQRCDAPALDRCAGWDAQASRVVCGVGYTDDGVVACGACARAFFPDASGACVACPSGNAVGEQAKPLLYLLAGLSLFALLVGAAVTATVKSRGGTVAGGLKRSAQFMVWTTTSLQVLVQVSKTATPGLPPYMSGFMTFLQIFILELPQLHPSCFDGHPFSREISLLGVSVALCGLSLAMLRKRWRVEAWLTAGSPSEALWRRKATPVLRRLLFTCATLLYPVTANTALALLWCVPEASYGDGGDGGGGAGAGDGAVSSHAATAATTRNVLAINRFHTCYAGEHADAAAAAYIAIAVSLLSYPLVTFSYVRRHVRRKAATRVVRRASTLAAGKGKRVTGLAALLGNAEQRSASATDFDPVVGVLVQGDDANTDTDGVPAKGRRASDGTALPAPRSGRTHGGRRASVLIQGIKGHAMNHWVDNDYQPRYFWFRHLQMALSLVLAGVYVYGASPTATGAAAKLAVTSTALLAFIALLAVKKPFMLGTVDRWKLPVKLFSLFVSLAAAVLMYLTVVYDDALVAESAAAAAAVVSGADGGGDDSSGSGAGTSLAPVSDNVSTLAATVEALSVVVLVMAALLFAVLGLAFWRVLTREAAREKRKMDHRRSMAAGAAMAGTGMVPGAALGSNPLWDQTHGSAAVTVPAVSGGSGSTAAAASSSAPNLTGRAMRTPSAGPSPAPVQTRRERMLQRERSALGRRLGRLSFSVFADWDPLQDDAASASDEASDEGSDDDTRRAGTSIGARLVSLVFCCCGRGAGTGRANGASVRRKSKGTAKAGLRRGKGRSRLVSGARARRPRGHGAVAGPTGSGSGDIGRSGAEVELSRHTSVGGGNGGPASPGGSGSKAVPVMKERGINPLADPRRIAARAAKQRSRISFSAFGRQYEEAPGSAVVSPARAGARGVASARRESTANPLARSAAATQSDYGIVDAVSRLHSDAHTRDGSGREGTGSDEARGGRVRRGQRGRGVSSR